VQAGEEVIACHGAEKPKKDKRIMPKVWWSEGQESKRERKKTGDIEKG